MLKKPLFRVALLDLQAREYVAQSIVIRNDSDLLRARIAALSGMFGRRSTKDYRVLLNDHLPYPNAVRSFHVDFAPVLITPTSRLAPRGVDTELGVKEYARFFEMFDSYGPLGWAE